MSSPYMQPFTLIFFSRKTDPITDIISTATKQVLKLENDDIWTHVGIVINRKVCPTLLPLSSKVTDNDETPYLWESTYSSKHKFFSKLEQVKDCETNGYTFGVQIRRLDDVLEAAKESGIKTSYTCDYVPNSIDVQYVSNLKNQFVKRKYTTSPFALYSAFNEGTNLVDESVSQYLSKGTVFCSQFVTLVLQGMNVIPLNVHARTMLPHELAVPNTSDNSMFASRFAHVKLTIISDSTRPSTCFARTSNVLYAIGRKVVAQLYKKQVRQALKLIIARLPISPDIIETVIEVATELVDR